MTEDETTEGQAAEGHAPEPQRIDLHKEVAFGASQQYDAAWIEYARTAPPPAVAGVDASLDPRFRGDPDDRHGGDETAYA